MFGVGESLPVELYVVGFKGNETTRYEFNVIASAQSTVREISLQSPYPQCNVPDCEGVLVGQLVLRIKPDELPELFKTYRIARTSVSSALMPIGWFTNQYHFNKWNTSSWYRNYCDPYADAIVTDALLECPCTQALAQAEERIFFQAPDCIGSPSSTQGDCMLSPGASMCYTTLPIKSGQGVRCCYDKLGNLLFSPNSPISGSYLLLDAVDSNYQHFGIAGKTAQVSFQLSHGKNYFTCCAAALAEGADFDRSCSVFSNKRAVSTSCGQYRYSVWSSVSGDPHFITSDGTKYTFNGVGEYWYLYSREIDFETQIQVRFSQSYDTSRSLTNATVLTALAYQYFGSKVEIHLQPLSYRQVGGRYLMILVDGVERFWNTFSEQFHSKFQITSDFQQSQVTIIAQDSGPLVHCAYVSSDTSNYFGSMKCRFALPNNYQRITFGLNGYYDGRPDNDIIARDQIISLVSSDPNDALALYNFGLTWNVGESESLFSYQGSDWYFYNKDVNQFMPELNYPPNKGIFNEATIKAVCGTGANRVQCQYDLEMTYSQTFALATLNELNSVDLQRAAYNGSGQDTWCDTLELPYASFTLSAGFSIGSEAHVNACLPGYVPASDVFFPVIYVCRADVSATPVWWPRPVTLCRFPSKIYGDAIDADVINPYDPVLPQITLPLQTGVTFSARFRFGGRSVFGFSLLADRGCVALEVGVTSAIFENGTSLPLSGEQDVPLLCPLIASYAKEQPAVADTYEILFKQLRAPDSVLTEIMRDIEDLSEGLDTSIQYTSVTNAYVFTWKNARSQSSDCSTVENCNNAPRNTYEVLIAVTDSQTTYAIFSYDSITWSGVENADGSVSDASSAVINYGDSKGFVALPYSNMDTASLSNLTQSGSISSVKGRFVYKVNDAIERIGCLNLPSDYPFESAQPITMNTYVADIYGARRLVLQAGCVTGFVSDSLFCGFQRKGTSDWIKTRAYTLESNSISCQTPRLPDVDVGDYLVSITFDGGNTWHYQQSLYLAGTITDSMPLSLIDILQWYSTNPGPLEIEWSTNLFSDISDSADVIIVGYAKSTNGVLSRREFTVGSVRANAGRYVLYPNVTKCTSDCADILIGQVVVRLGDPSLRYWMDLQYAELPSSLVPIGWFVNDYNTNISGSQWYLNYCDANSQKTARKCPCKSDLAEADYRNFIQASSCSGNFGSDCLAVVQNSNCFVTLPLDATGAGLQCCYDQSGNLLFGQDKPHLGSFVLDYSPFASKYLHNNDAITYLSYYLSHVKNLFACCSANSTTEVDSNCFAYAESRSVAKTCSDFVTSGVSTVVGDPHVITPDENVYTFNGIGEYWLLQSTSSASLTPLDIQVRFQNGLKTRLAYLPNKTIRASLLIAIAMRFGDLKVQIEVQHPSYLAGEGRKLALFVNDEEKFFYEYPAVQYFKNVRVESSGSHSSFHIRTTFDGPDVTCEYSALTVNVTFGSLSCSVLLPTTYKGVIYGLIGKWDGDKSNDLVAKNSIGRVTETSADPANLTAVDSFGKTWQVAEGDSLFRYSGTSYNSINEDAQTFLPELDMKPNSTLTDEEIEEACEPLEAYSDRCEYDYRITGSRSFASATGFSLREVDTLQESLVNANTAFCPMLDAPYTVKTYSNGLEVNSKAVVTGCVTGYSSNSGVSFPQEFICTSSGSTFAWHPTPSMELCVKTVITTESTISITGTSTADNQSTKNATTPQTMTTQEDSKPSIATEPTPTPDNTAVIILSIVCGILAILLIAAVVYYFCVLKDKHAKVFHTEEFLHARQVEMSSTKITPDASKSDFQIAMPSKTFDVDKDVVESSL